MPTVQINIAHFDRLRRKKYSMVQWISTMLDPSDMCVCILLQGMTWCVQFLGAKTTHI